MKRISKLIIVIALSFLFLLNVNASEKEKINVYIFRGEGCPHCEEALEFFDKLSGDEEYSKYYNLKQYEVWYNEDNAKLMQNVAKELNEEASGVPYIVIGKKTFSGFASSMEEEIKKEIKDNYNSKSYTDIVKELTGTKKESKKDNNIVVPILIVCGVAVVVIGGLVIISKKM